MEFEINEIGKLDGAIVFGRQDHSVSKTPQLLRQNDSSISKIGLGGCGGLTNWVGS